MLFSISFTLFNNEDFLPRLRTIRTLSDGAFQGPKTELSPWTLEKHVPLERGRRLIWNEFIPKKMNAAIFRVSDPIEKSQFLKM